MRTLLVTASGHLRVIDLLGPVNGLIKVEIVCG